MTYGRGSTVGHFEGTPHDPIKPKGLFSLVIAIHQNGTVQQDEHPIFYDDYSPRPLMLLRLLVCHTLPFIEVFSG
jgi:hypothetical protein